MVGDDWPEPVFVPYRPARPPLARMCDRADALVAEMSARRSIRQFSTDPVPRELVESAIRIAGTAPSGAHRQPWTWVVIGDPELKRRIRAAAEVEERESYEHRMPEDWLRALAPLGTDWVKTHLTDAPWVVVLFARPYEVMPDGSRAKNYYVSESCGIAAGFFIAAVHLMGLAALTHTPSPMRFLSEVLDRPANERPYLVMPVGYPATDCRVPDLTRKPLEDITVWR